VSAAKKRRVNRIVLDASAVLAALNREPGSEMVASVFSGATISAVNYSEVLKKSIEFGGELSKVRALLDRQSLKIIPFDEMCAVAAASILPQTSNFGLSFADRACVSLGMQLAYVVLTAESRMSLPKLGIEVRLIRKAGKPRS